MIKPDHWGERSDSLLPAHQEVWCESTLLDLFDGLIRRTRLHF